MCVTDIFVRIIYRLSICNIASLKTYFLTVIIFSFSVSKNWAVKTISWNDNIYWTLQRKLKITLLYYVFISSNYDFMIITLDPNK